MKNSVIQFFNNLPKLKTAQFNEALALFKKASKYNDGQFRFYNKAGYTPANLENLFYDLKKMANVTDAEIRKGAYIKVLSKEEISEKVASDKVLDEHQLGVKFEGHTAAENKEEVFTKAPDDVKAAIKFQDEFPFLKEKDCPDEFHILTGKKFAAYYAWLDAHKHLLVNIKDTNQDASPIAMTDEEVSEMAITAVENFETNQLIWKELNHYKETGKILGKHPIFLERALKEGIEKMTVAQASKRLNNLDNYIRRDKRNLEKAQKSGTEKDIEKYADKIVKWETEEKLIKAKHNL